MAAPRSRFTKAELGLVATASAIVFTRVFAFSLTTLGFTEYAKTLVPAGTSAASADVLAGIAFGAYAVTMALAQLITGVLSDRVGRRPVLLAGTFVFVAGAAASAMAHSIWPLIAAQLLQGLGGVSSSAMAAVGETVPAERRTMAMAMVGVPAGIGVFLGFVIGPLLVGSTAHPGLMPFASLFWITAALGALASLPILLRPLPPPIPGLAEPRRSLGLPVLGLALAGFTINYAMRATMFDFQQDVLVHIGDGTLAIVLLVAFAVMGLASRAVDRSGAAWQPILVALVALAVAAPLFRLESSFWVVAVAGCVFFAAHAVLSAVLPSQVSRLAGRSGGLGHGIQLVVAYLGGWAGAVAAGFFKSRSDFLDTFVVLGAVALVAAAMVAWSLRPTSPGLAGPAPADEV
ncbi:MAG: MFS transporter [bacterium]